MLFLEHKHLYRQTYNKGPYPGADYMLPFGKGALRREGADVVVITWGALVQRSLLAAQQAEKDGISVAVFDLRTIMPYDWDGIAELVKKTNKVIVAHEDTLTCGFGAEISARIGEELFDYLLMARWLELIRPAAGDPAEIPFTAKPGSVPSVDAFVADLRLVGVGADQEVGVDAFKAEFIGLTKSRITPRGRPDLRRRAPHRRSTDGAGGGSVARDRERDVGRDTEG